MQPTKQILRVLVLLILFSKNLAAQNDNPKYQKRLADSLGADDYGMKMYTLVILKTGTAQTTDKAKTDSLFNGHMQNIQRLANIGKLVVAGPLQKNDKTYRGIFILNTSSTDEARKLLATDPAIEAKLLEPEIYGWYGSAALPMYLPASETVGKKRF